MTHVMIDLETYGLRPGCPVLSIGACAVFDGQRLRFYGVAQADQSSYGLNADPETVKWWAGQSEQARAIFSDTNAVPLYHLLCEFAEWLSPDAYVWGNGADFDLPILAAAYHAAGLVVPWKPSNGRCYRTIKNLAPTIKMVRKGTHHNALDDAISQAAHLEELAKVLGITLG